MQQIHYLTHLEIDKNRWDDCIFNSAQEMVYAYSWYLDIVSPNWDALITDNYQAVMPLTHKKKWGIKYLYTPPGVGQLGIFSKLLIEKEQVNAFLKAIPPFFRLIDIDLNFSNNCDKIKMIERINYILPLNNNYNDIYQNYHRLAKRKLKIAANNNLVLIKEFSVEAILQKAFDTLHNKTKFPTEYISIFKELTKMASSKEMCHSYGIVDADERLMASDIFFVGRRRLSSVIAGNDATGNLSGAFYMVLNEIIKSNSNKDLILDFEGSDIEGIAFVFKNLGAKKEVYPHYKSNHLPWPIKLLK